MVTSTRRRAGRRRTASSAQVAPAALPMAAHLCNVRARVHVHVHPHVAHSRCSTVHVWRTHGIMHGRTRAVV
eukprot:scaffold858_cov65-Phaeocystis_antarctica.AAC.2